MTVTVSVTATCDGCASTLEDAASDDPMGVVGRLREQARKSGWRITGKGLVLCPECLAGRGLPPRRPAPPSSRGRPHRGGS